jgi:hypothetical protein
VKGKQTLSFVQWLGEVDKLVIKKLGVSLHDLSDKLWRDMYDSGMSITSAAAKCKRKDMWD